MRSQLLFAAAIVLTGAATLRAAEDAPRPARVYQTQHCGVGCPRIDGLLDDACWDLVDWGEDFTQWRPDEGKPPSQQTAFKILYDDHNLYVAYRAFDAEPEKIVSRLTRRDWFPGDWVEINIDSYHDRRTAYSFTSSVSGVRGDEFISQDGDSWDGSWDPIWDLKTCVDAEGWTAELRIPLSQLRYQPQAEQVWGIQVTRRVFREEERSLWQPKSQEETGWVSRFGELRGLVGLPVQRRVELLPYTVARHERFAAPPDDPFTDGREGKFAAGLDGKLGVSSNLTLDFTVNPDFGQVEADPSELNLSAFETFFAEKRPFFIEGNDILHFRIAPAITGGRNTNDLLFYSRRIGRRPDWPWATTDYPAHVDMPEASSILGAFKLTGKTPGGLSVGVLESVTAKELARATGDAGTIDVPVEPATNFFVGRAQQSYRDGDTRIGGMLTAVNRHAESGLEFMHRQAYAGGVDVATRFGNREWRLEGNALFSNVRGDSLALAGTQRSSARYFQRPDNDHADFDPTRRSLSGHAGSLRFGRSRSTGWRFETQVGWRSPGFEVGDLGYMREADVVNQSTWVGWSAQPSRVLKSVSINGNQWHDFDFGGTRLRRMGNVNSNLTFRNNMSLGLGVTVVSESVSNTLLRGGPAMTMPGEYETSFWFNSDGRRTFTYNFGGWQNRGAEDSFDAYGVWVSLGLRPTDALRLTLNPEYISREMDLQYIGQRSVADEARYLFGALDQETLSMTIRADYAVSPNLTLQVYGAPFVTAGRYDRFKRITDPDAASFTDRFHTFAGGEIAEEGGGYDVDEDADGSVDYSLGNPDFNFRDFNSNVVLRWEFSPGSLLYLVWSQSRSDFAAAGDFHPGHDLDALFGVRPHDVFLLKVSKWLSL